MRRDWLGSSVGLSVFLGGVLLLGLTFYLAFRTFSVPPSEALGVQVGKTLDLNGALNSFATIITRVVLLLVMTIVGALVSSRGIRLYAECRSHHDHHGTSRATASSTNQPEAPTTAQ